MLPGFAAAASLADLQASGELTAQVVLRSDGPQYQKAPVIFAVEIGSMHRFESNIRVREFTIAGAVTRSISKFPFTENRRQGGVSWPYQSWIFQLNAEHVGPLAKTAIQVDVAIETQLHGVVSGTLKLALPTITVVEAPGTADLQQWLAAQQFTVEDIWEGQLKAYQIGDAFTRIRRFVAHGVPAMAIPASPEIAIAGAQVYTAPALLEDKIIKGVLVGHREERTVVTLQKEGDFSVPLHEYVWFNIDTQTVERIALPAYEFSVGEGADALLPSDELLSFVQIREFSAVNLLKILGALVLALAVIVLSLRWLRRSVWFQYMQQHRRRRQQAKRRRTLYSQAAHRRNAPACLNALYQQLATQEQWQVLAAYADDSRLHGIAARLLAHVYDNEPALSSQELMALWPSAANVAPRHSCKQPMVTCYKPHRT